MSDYGLPEGWTLITRKFAYGRRWGVAIENDQHGRVKRRFAIGATIGIADEQHAIRDVLPKLHVFAKEDDAAREAHKAKA